MIRNGNMNERQAEIINEPDKMLSITEIRSQFGTAYQTAAPICWAWFRTDISRVDLSGRKWSFSDRALLMK